MLVRLSNPVVSKNSLISAKRLMIVGKAKASIFNLIANVSKITLLVI